MTERGALWPRLRLLAGLLLMGQGLLVLTRILDHEAPRWLGLLVLLLGAALASWGRLPSVALRRSWLVAALGALAAGGVVAYNLLARSSLGLPELAILAYGVALLAASRHLERRVWHTDVGTLVAYSFPLLLAPLSLYAVNAATTTAAGATPLAWYIRHGLVAPMALALAGFGIETSVLGDTVRLGTSRGALFLTVGVVCAGLYAGALFMGVFALFAWQQRTPPMRLAAYLALGLFGLHVANVLRLVLLALVGWRWGGEALQSFHQHAGWVIFLVWTLAFWALVLRRFEGRRAPAAPA